MESKYYIQSCTCTCINKPLDAVINDLSNKKHDTYMYVTVTQCSVQNYTCYVCGKYGCFLKVWNALVSEIMIVSVQQYRFSLRDLHYAFWTLSLCSCLLVMCLFRVLFLTKRVPQIEHLNGFSPVCVLMCWIKCDLNGMYFPQIWHSSFWLPWVLSTPPTLTGWTNTCDQRNTLQNIFGSLHWYPTLHSENRKNCTTSDNKGQIKVTRHW